MEMTRTLVFDRFNVRTLLVVVALLFAAGCGRDTTHANVRVNDMRDLASSGDRESIDALIEGLEDHAESVRREALRALSETLKRKIYYDPSASAEERSRQMLAVRQMWENLKERDLVDDVQRRVPTQYFYDLNSGEVFEDISRPGPIETSSGTYQGMPAGVRAVMFACRDCGDESDRYVGWLEVPALALKEYGVEFKTAPSLDNQVEIERRRAFRSPEGGEWAVFGTPEAEAIAAEGRRCDDRKMPLICRPGR